MSKQSAHLAMILRAPHAQPCQHNDTPGNSMVIIQLYLTFVKTSQLWVEVIEENIIQYLNVTCLI